MSECLGCVAAHSGSVMHNDKHDERCKAEHAMNTNQSNNEPRVCSRDTNTLESLKEWAKPDRERHEFVGMSYVPARCGHVRNNMTCAQPRDAEIHAVEPPKCPEDCASCSGEACELCGAGCWSNANDCQHDVIERHTIKAADPPAQPVAAPERPRERVLKVAVTLERSTGSQCVTTLEGDEAAKWERYIDETIAYLRERDAYPPFEKLKWSTIELRSDIAARQFDAQDDIGLWFTEEEKAAIADLSSRLDLRPAKVVKQALRVYQLQVVGEPHFSKADIGARSEGEAVLKAIEREREYYNCNNDLCPIGSTMVGWPHPKWMAGCVENEATPAGDEVGVVREIYEALNARWRDVRPGNEFENENRAYNRALTQILTKFQNICTSRKITLELSKVPVREFTGKEKS